MDSEFIQILEMLAALVMAVIAYWQNRQKKQAELAQIEAESGMHLAQAQQWEAEEEKADVVSFFDPQDDRVIEPPESIPSRSWKMNEETTRWVTVCHTAEEQAYLLRQIANAEDQKKIQYFISVATAYYEIEYGLVKGGGKGDNPF